MQRSVSAGPVIAVLKPTTAAVASGSAAGSTAPNATTQPAGPVDPIALAKEMRRKVSPDDDRLFGGEHYME
eukprot:10954588-Prorocentrum_lima.AAC.1